QLPDSTLDFGTAIFCSLSDIRLSIFMSITGTSNRRQWLRDATALPPNGRRARMPQSPNRILDSLPQNIFAAMAPHLQHVTLPFGQVIAETGQPVGKVYFPFNGVVSLVVEMEEGATI